LEKIKKEYKAKDARIKAIPNSGNM